MPKEAYRALKQLSQNKDIIIKKADKGSAIVIQDHEDYIKEAHHQLHDVEYYKKLAKPIYPETAQMFLRVLNDLAHLPGEVGGHNIKGLCGISKKQPRIPQTST